MLHRHCSAPGRKSIRSLVTAVGDVEKVHRASERIPIIRPSIQRTLGQFQEISPEPFLPVTAPPEAAEIELYFP